MCTFPQIIHCWADQKRKKKVQFLPICLGEPISLLGLLIGIQRRQLFMWICLAVPALKVNFALFSR